MQNSQRLARLPAVSVLGGVVKTAVTSCARTDATFVRSRTEKSNCDRRAMVMSFSLFASSRHIAQPRKGHAIWFSTLGALLLLDGNMLSRKIVRPLWGEHPMPRNEPSSKRRQLASGAMAKKKRTRSVRLPSQRHTVNLLHPLSQVDKDGNAEPACYHVWLVR